MALTPFVAGWHFAGTVAALGCVIVILLAVPILWTVRTKIEALQGMFIFLAVAFVATFSFLLSAYFMRLPLLASWPPAVHANASNCFWILLLFPTLALFFWFVGRPNREVVGPNGP